jgi:quercetin dioxygenase-like cupin family protein
MIIKNSTVSTNDLGGGLRRKILASGGKLMMVEVYFDKGGVGAMHSHPHEQVSYIVNGAFEFNIEGKKDVVKAGDTVYIGSNVPHGVVALEDSLIVDIFTPQREDFLKM